MNVSPPRFSARVILLDIDETLTGTRPEAGHPPHPLVRALIERDRLPADEAERIVRAAEAAAPVQPGETWPVRVLAELGLTEDILWPILCEQAEAVHFVYPDAAVLLSALRQRPEVRIFTATTNPRLIILAKLAIAGLADRHGSPYFDDCFGGEETATGGKAGPPFFQAILDRVGATPAETLMIGDDSAIDLAFARAIGIEQVVLPRRAQSEPWVREDGAVYVKDLACVADFLSG
ncbi:MAG: HAD family hydrolase [Lentisphaerae bacterium]|nr:HAD family hydrolase [Lentisphaerota bacterium]